MYINTIFKHFEKYANKGRDNKAMASGIARSSFGAICWSKTKRKQMCVVGGNHFFLTISKHGVSVEVANKSCLDIAKHSFLLEHSVS
jgi:hypothetical protein